MAAVSQMAGGQSASSFQFDPESHIYTLDGVRIPSVTQVLESAGIISYDFIPAERRQLYLDRGRRVHAMTHYDDEGELDEVSVEHGELGYLRAWRKWRGIRQPNWDVIERPMFSRLFRYAGTLDRSGFTGSNFRVLADVKSGHSPWWVAVQLAAYGALLDKPVQQYIAVELHEDGTYREVPIPIKDVRQNLDTFYAALRLYHVKHEKRGAFV